MIEIICREDLQKGEEDASKESWVLPRETGTSAAHLSAAPWNAVPLYFNGTA